MRCLVTGGTGFIGGEVVRQLNMRKGVTEVGVIARHFPRPSQGEQQYIGDVTNSETCEYLIREFRPDIIFHLAGNALVKNGDKALFDTNATGTLNMLSHAPPKCRFILASSSTIYGPTGFPWHEESLTNPHSIYAASKVCAEELVKMYTKLGKVQGRILRYVAQVGKHSTHGLCHDIIRKLDSDSPTLSLIGEKPGSRKPFMAVSDTAAATVFLAFDKWHLDGTAIFNVAPRDSITVEQVANIIMEEKGKRKPIEWQPNQVWAGDQKTVVIWPEKLLYFGFKPQFPTSEAAIRSLFHG